MYNMLPQQKNIYNIEMAFPGIGICNLGGIISFDVDIDINILKQACVEIVRNNSAFWIKISESGKVYFDKVKTLDIAEYDYRDISKEETDRIFSEWMNEALFGYDKYLFEVKIVFLNNSNCLYVKGHHIIADGFSVALFTKKISEIYNAILNDKYVPEEETAYMDKIINSSSAEVMSLTAEIKSSFNMEEYVSFVNKNHEPRAEVISILVASDNEADDVIPYSDLKKYLRRNRTSVEAMVYGALVLYFGRIQGKDRMCVGRNILNREGKEFGMIGMQVLTLPYVVCFDEECPVKDYYSEIRKKLALNAKQDITRAFLPDVIVSYRPDKLMQSSDIGKCIEYAARYSEVPMKISINEADNKIELQLKYQVSVFSDKDIVRISKKINHIIKQSIDNPEKKLADINLLEDWEKDFIKKYNETHQSGKAESLVIKCIKNFFKYSEKTAMIFEKKKYTYQDIFVKICMVSKWIQDYADASKEKIVGVCFGRSMWHPVIVYAAWMVGYAYLPISNKNSEEKNKDIFHKCGVVIDDAVIKMFEKGYAIDGIPKKPEDLKNELANKHDAAYYMFTSGTTGEPKAVEISHDSLRKRIEWMAYQFEDGIDVVLHKTSNDFDVSMWELVLPWAYGKTMCVANEGDEKNPHKIIEYIINEHVTIIHFVPSMFQFFLSYIIKNRVNLKDLKYIILSGERLDASLVKRAYNYMKDVYIYNLYGPTECTIDVSCYRCGRDDDHIPIGVPVWDTQLYVRNNKHQIMPVGESGELVVEGDLVGRYSDIFSNNRQGGFKIIDGKKCYYTGDYAHLSEDGFMYYDGRKDSQKKIRGMRVNLEEIETVLNNSFDNSIHVVLCIKDRIIDFYEGELDKDNVISMLKKRFPHYYIPSEIINVEQIPVKEHGKVDKDKLVYMYNIGQMTQDSFVGKEDILWEIERIQEILIECAQKYLPAVNILSDTDLFDKGMDSISTLSFLLDCEQYGLKIPYSVFLSNSTVKELANHLYYNEQDNNNKVVFYYSEQKLDELILMIPFAGGTALSFSRLAKKLNNTVYDLAVVNMSLMVDEHIDFICKKVIGELSDNNYSKIHIISSCVGSTLAIFICKALDKRAGSMFICESLPYYGVNILGKHFTIWDIMPDRMVAYILKKLRGHRFKCDKRLLNQFRKDVRKSSYAMKYMDVYKPECTVSYVYGSKDLLTLGYRRKVKKWEKLIDADMEVYSIDNARHFLIEDNAGELVKIFDKVMGKSSQSGNYQVYRQ